MASIAVHGDVAALDLLDMAPQSPDLVEAHPPGEDLDDTIDSETAVSKPPLLQPAASHLISCLRAPCLKRTTSTSPTPSSLHSRSASPDEGSGSASSGDDAVTTSSSFAAIKRVGRAGSTCKRQVHFDAAPPEAGITHSRDQYDRRPIECTRRGEQNDLSLPPRGACPLYTGDADDEAGINEDDDDEDEQSRAEKRLGFARWSRLKNLYGAVRNPSTNLAASMMSCSPTSDDGKLAHVAREESGGLGSRSMVSVDAVSEKLDVDDEDIIPAPAVVDDGSDNDNSCSQPFHGVRSFGRISNRPDEPYVHESKGYGRRALCLSGTDILESINAEEEEDDPEHEAFKQAVYAALAISPNATPMPSPSVRSRWEAVTSYFDGESIKESGSAKSSGSTTPGPGISIVDETGHCDVIREGAAAPTSLPSASSLAAARDERESGIGRRAALSLTMPRPSSSPSAESATNASSSSPTSSRSSSAGTFVSPGGEGADNERGEGNTFDSAFGLHNMPSIAESAIAIEKNVSTRRADSLQQSEDSELISCASSSTSVGTFTTGKSSSCSTSPEIGSHEHDVCSGEHSSLPPASLSSTKASEQTEEEQNASAETGEALHDDEQEDMCRFFGRPLRSSSLLVVPDAMRPFSSACTSGEHSPCVQSADERGNDSDEVFSSTRRSKALGPSMLRRSSSNCGTTRKSKRNIRRAVSSAYQGGELCSTAEPSEDKMDSNSPDGSDAKPSRAPRHSRRGASSPMGPRSKSMSSALPATLKRSSFAASTFRSEVDDDGALGGF